MDYHSILKLRNLWSRNFSLQIESVDSYQYIQEGQFSFQFIGRQVQ
jgi:hypothetical protein